MISDISFSCPALLLYLGRWLCLGNVPRCVDSPGGGEDSVDEHPPSLELAPVMKMIIFARSYRVTNHDERVLLKRLSDDFEA